MHRFMALFRKMILRIFKHINPGNITIRHHYTGRPLYLHAFKHKGYWYHGKRRESASMQLFQRSIKQGETVIEIGGHIGYISMFYSKLVGTYGHVVVFEPGPNNLPYLHRNLQNCNNVEIISSAVSDTNGTATFFLEELTGQNNTLIRDYSIFMQNRKSAGYSENQVPVTVKITTLDSFVKRQKFEPDFIKIDVEGAEYQVIVGGAETIRKYKPMMMIEISQNNEAVISSLTKHGYLLFSPEMKKYDGKGQNVNVFAIHQEKYNNFYLSN